MGLPASVSGVAHPRGFGGDVARIEGIAGVRSRRGTDRLIVRPARAGALLAVTWSRRIGAIVIRQTTGADESTRIRVAQRGKERTAAAVGARIKTLGFVASLAGTTRVNGKGETLDTLVAGVTTRSIPLFAIRISEAVDASGPCQIAVLPQLRTIGLAIAIAEVVSRIANRVIAAGFEHAFVG